ncbi:MAG: cytochrome C biogenesis protein [Ignavibacteria bacterium]|jgi:cytochrome c-type biogenesis protein|nr:cytochrome C biogenesis protein [Ignavibacteria bacterium]MCU7503028.1 cytochrome C biogenesis protein [Ignavibacteria bacterium]MCU7516552.1 cytochrome C biogenesis protein [Ignavibacteria bacterium]
MLNEIFTQLNSALYGNIYLAVLASFIWGILSILLSPCHLSSIPLVIGYITSQGSISIRRTFSISLTFAFGILLTITMIGMITLSLGRLMGDIGTLGNYLVAIVFFVIGLYLLDLIKLPWNGISLSSTRFKGLRAAFVLGLLFGIGLGPCTFAFMAPVLGVVFQAATTSIVIPVSLLAAFALGHCFVIAGAGTLSQVVQKYLNWTGSSNVMLYTKRICGILVILGGVYIVYNQ